MVKPEIKNMEPLTMVEVKKELEEIQKRDEELGFRSNKTLEYLNQFVKLDKKKSEELASKLESLKITRLRPDVISKLVDLLPVKEDYLKTVLQGYTITLSQADQKKVIDAIKEFAPE